MIKRLLLVFTLLFVVVSAAEAQSTSVTLQVTDAGAQTWNNGTWSVLLVSQVGASTYGPPFNLVGGGTVPNQSQSGSLNATGGASMTLTPNASVTPAQSQWQFKVCPQQGVPFQCFIQSVTIAGGSQTVTLTPPTIVVSCGPGVNAYTNSEVNCGVGGQYFNLTSSATQVCTVASGNSCTTWIAGGAAATLGTINPASSAYGAKFDARWKADGALTSGQPTVTSATIAFTQADVGKKIYTVNSANGLTRLNGTILSVQSATSATASVNASATESTSGIVVCTDDTAAIVAAWNDALAQNKLLYLPSGATCVSGPLFQALGPSFPRGSNFSVQGSGPGTVLVVTPDFSFSTCNANGFGGCLYGVSTQSFAFPDGLRPWPQVGNFTVTGLGSIFSGAATGINLFTSGAGVVWHDIVISDFCSATSASSMFSMATEDRAYNLNIQGVNCPNTNNQMPPISVVGSSVDIYSPIIAYLAQRAIIITNTSDVTVHGGLFTQTALNTGGNPHSAVGLVNSTNVRFIGTTVSNGTSSVNGWDVDGTSNLVLDGVHCANNAAASSACLNVQAGGIAKIGRYSQLSTSIGAVPITNAGTVFDDGTNAYGTGTSTGIAPTCAMTTGGGTGPACAVVAGSTNEGGTVRMTPGTAPGTTGTTTITFAGTFAGASGTTPSCVFDPANTGTGTWNLAADTQLQTRSTTVPVFTWNNTVALTAASTYDVDYVCRAR